jgi:hypothetical protein
MAIQQLFTSLNKGIATGNTYVGQLGRLWYDPITNTLRVSDGSTPGGIIINGGGGGSAIPVSNSYIQITPAVSSFNFIGSGIAATAVGNAVTVNVPGAGYITFDGGSPSNDYVGGPAFDCGGVT